MTNTAVNAAAADIAFTDINGNAHTFAEGERVIFYFARVNNRATAKDLTIFQDADAGDDLDAAETIDVFSFAAAGSEEANYPGLPSRKINAAGTNTFMVLASAAGAIDLLLLGEVIKS